MKKLIISSLFILGICSQSSFGQLKVDSVGHVTVDVIGTTSSTMSVGGTGSNYYNFHVKGKRSGIYGEFKTFQGSGYNSSLGVGVHGYAVPGGTDNFAGVFATSERGSHGSLSGTKRSIGVYSTAGDGSTGYNYGVFGILKFTPTNGNNQNGAAIFGSTDTSNLFGENTGGRYAAYFVGNSKQNGNLEITGGTIITNSALSENVLDMDVSNLSSMRESTSERLVNLSAIAFHQPLVTYTNRNQSQDIPTDSICDIESLSNESNTTNRVIQPSQRAFYEKIHYGIPVEQLEFYYPELVYETEDGSKGVNYIEMIPLLLQSIKELKAEIDELKGNDVKKVASRNAGATIIGDTEADLLSVSQNEPNPFTESTTIKLSIPKKTHKAALMVYDMSGRQIKQININERGKTSVNITSEGLASGMYLYSLIADGKVISTKRMILTK